MYRSTSLGLLTIRPSRSEGLVGSVSGAGRGATQDSGRKDGSYNGVGRSWLVGAGQVQLKGETGRAQHNSPGTSSRTEPARGYGAPRKGPQKPRNRTLRHYVVLGKWLGHEAKLPSFPVPIGTTWGDGRPRGTARGLSGVLFSLRM